MALKKWFIPILISFIALCVISCETPPVEEDCEIEQQGESIFSTLERGDFEIMTIDSCEYLVVTEDYGHAQKGFGFMAHKGNCSNPVHVCGN